MLFLSLMDDRMKIVKMMKIMMRYDRTTWESVIVSFHEKHCHHVSRLTFGVLRTMHFENT
jgi:hypothetical protein